MLIKITLSDTEIRTALANAIRNKMPELKFYDQDIVIDGSVKFKRRSVRKDNVKRMSATVSCAKGI